jgi:hypothetical protein
VGLAAQLSLITLGITAETLDVELRAAIENRPNNQLYIGQYPAELAPLVAATRSAITNLTADLQAYKDALCGEVTIDVAVACVTPAFAVGSSTSQLKSQIDAWGPYI